MFLTALVSALIAPTVFAKNADKRQPASGTVLPLDATYVLVGDISDDQMENCQGSISFTRNSMKTMDFLRLIYPNQKIVNASRGSGGEYRFVVHSKDIAPGKWVIDIKFRDESEFTWTESVSGIPNFKGDLCRNAQYQSKGKAE